MQPASTVSLSFSETRPRPASTRDDYIAARCWFREVLLTTQTAVWRILLYRYVGSSLPRGSARKKQAKKASPP